MYNKEFGKAVQRLRISKGFSQENLAKSIGAARGYISMIESGKVNVTLLKISELAKALDVDEQEFFQPLKIIRNPQRVGEASLDTSFIKLGGTWDMEQNDGIMNAAGNLDEKELTKLEAECEYDEAKLTRILYKIFKNTKPLDKEIALHLHWAGDMAKYIEGDFYSYCSFDSSNFRSSIQAAVIASLIEFLYKNPKKQLLLGMGTDTVDLFAPLLDVLFYNSQFKPILITGANRSYREKHSDAPANFNFLAQATQFDLAKGAYYLFNNNIFIGGDLVKIDPSENPVSIEGMHTFFAPHGTSTNLLNMRNFSKLNPRKPSTLANYDPIELFESLNQILTIDLGDQNDIDDIVATIRSDKYRAIILKSHGLGNAPHIISEALKQALDDGKYVINISRTLIGETSGRYQTSLFHSKSLPEGMLIDGKTLNAQTARAFALLAILEDWTIDTLQSEIEKYVKFRLS
jgi:L-asparaginase/Glu-tRNA(Gln) amidotransferase subunit D/transcriptional regulator with XRE-family HTH domain